MIWRYRSILFFFIIIFAMLITRLFYWQIVRAQELVEIGEQQYGQYIKLTPERGEIKTSDKFPVAANRITYLIFANPKELDENEKIKTAKILANTLLIDEASISAKLALNRFWVPINNYNENSVKEQIEKLNLKGVGFEEQTVRFYPEASLAAKIIGFVGKDDAGENKGYFGLEGYYDRQLTGKTGLAKQIKDALGRPILAEMNNNSGKIDGRNLILFTDRSIQYILEDTLRKDMETYGAQASMGIIMEPKTGGILALSAFPSFDPRSYQEYSNDLYLDPVISSAYEPGSTFKPLIMSAAIDSNLVTPETKCTICDKQVEIGGFTIKTWNDTYQPDITMVNVIRDSDNTGMVFVAQKLGLQRMIKYLNFYGLGQNTGIDLQGEMSPALRPESEWYPIDLATAGFGQGISVTPIQLITAFNSIANSGKIMEPHVVAKVETSEGEVIDITPKVLSQPISNRTANIMREILVNAVKKGEAKWAAPKGYRIAGKTGTAQIPIAGHYDTSKTIASFIGFAPADDPKFIMLIIFDRPQSSIYGAETAAPTFFKIASKILAYYGIPPSN